MLTINYILPYNNLADDTELASDTELSTKFSQFKDVADVPLDKYYTNFKGILAL